MIGSTLKDPVLIGAIIAAIGGGALSLYSPALQIIPSFDTSGAMHEAATGGGGADLSRLARMFDLQDLPPPAPPVIPPPDPAAALKQHRFLGSAASDDRQRALFDAGGSVRAIAPGDILEGFTLTHIDLAGAVFVKDGVEVFIPLNSN